MKKLRYSIFYVFVFVLCGWTSLSASVLWSFPKDLSAEGISTLPVVKVNDEGKGIAAWLELVTSNTVVRASIFEDGQWSDPITLNPQTSLSELVFTHSVQVALNNEGHAVVVWDEGPFSGPVTIRAATLIDHTWRPTANIAFLLSTPLAFPQVAIDSKGNAVAIWQESLLPGVRIQVAALPHQANVWSIPVTISNTEIANQPQIAAGEKENFVGIWLGDGILRARAFTFKAILKNQLSTGIVNLSSPTAIANFPVISTNKKGHAAVIWSEVILPAINSSIETRMFRFREGKIQDLSEMTILSNPAFINTIPDVKINRHGQAVAAWQSTVNSTDFYVFASIFRDGKWRPSTLISDLTFPFATFPKVGIDGKGNAVALWVGNDNVEPGLFKAIQSSIFHKQWDTPFQLSAPGQNTFNPQVATNREGETIAIWLRTFTRAEASFVQTSHTNINIESECRGR